MNAPDFYHEYLASERWRQRRNRALRLALYRCATCGARRGLEVHHTTYERLGDELDADLQVLCRGCHLGWHRQQIAGRLHLRIVRLVINEMPGATTTDLMEPAKTFCAKQKLPYDTARLGRAFDLVQEPSRRTRPPRRQLPPHVVEFTVTEARALWTKLVDLEARPLIKTMPSVGPLSETDYHARRQELREQAHQIGSWLP